jgi:hypothetical protein
LLLQRSNHHHHSSSPSNITIILLLIRALLSPLLVSSLLLLSSCHQLSPSLHLPSQPNSTRKKTFPHKHLQPFLPLINCYQLLASPHFFHPHLLLRAITSLLVPFRACYLPLRNRYSPASKLQSAHLHFNHFSYHQVCLLPFEITVLFCSHSPHLLSPSPICTPS